MGKVSMNVQVVMPKIGLTMREGKIVEWKKKEGEWVEKGEILFVFETEKVTYEVEALQSGFLAKIEVQVDESAPIGTVVGVLVETKGEGVEVAAAEKPETKSDEVEQTLEVKPSRADRIRATPMARKIARERGLDLKELSGSGIGGRIRRGDVEAASRHPSPEERPAPGESGKLVKSAGMRRIIAQKMLASTTQAAQTYMTISVDASKLLETKDKLSPLVEKKVGIRPTLTDFLMKIAGDAISIHPVMNTRWTEEGILWLDECHMGMAMALEEGLIVPVIWNIQKKSLSEIARMRADLVERGRAGKLTPDEMKGSTFTLSSLGMFGIEEFTAIINQPESAILAVSAIVDRPVVIHKEVVARPVMKLSLTYDHRVIDGAKAARFMMTLKQFLEDPVLTLA